MMMMMMMMMMIYVLDYNIFSSKNNAVEIKYSIYGFCIRVIFVH